MLALQHFHHPAQQASVSCPGQVAAQDAVWVVGYNTGVPGDGILLFKPPRLLHSLSVLAQYGYDLLQPKQTADGTITRMMGRILNNMPAVSKCR